jgi:signal peptidase II
MPPRWPPFALAAAFVVADQLSKSWVVAEVPLGARVASWAGFLHLTHTRNSGAAFGLLRDRVLDLGVTTVDGVQLLGMVSLAVALALAVWLALSRTLGTPTRLALGAIMGGAIGNGIDRWRLGYVTDFVHAQVGWFDFPVFNVADVGISVGATALLLATFVAGRHAGHATGRTAAPGEAPPPAAPPAPDARRPGDADTGGGDPDTGGGDPDTAGRDDADTAGGDDAVSDAPTRSASDR